MKKLFFVFVLALFSISIATAQDCNCRKNLEWVKKTFEENDAGFEYALKNKSRAAYDVNILDHTGPPFWRILGHRSGAYRATL